MNWKRAALSILVGVAVAAAPMTGAWAAITSNTTKTEQTKHDTSKPAAAMTDCAKMAHTLMPSKCPYCDKDKGCAADICLAKCFKVFGVVFQPAAERQAARLLYQLPPPYRSPDWRQAPQPPPPRA